MWVTSAVQTFVGRTQYSSSHVIHQVPGVPKRITSSYKCKRCAKQEWGTAGLTNQENLLWNILVNDSLGYRDHSIAEFGIWLGLLKVSTKPKVLGFRRANFSSLKAHVADGSGEREGGSVFWNLPWSKNMWTGWKASREGKQAWSEHLKVCHMRKKLGLLGLEKRRLRGDLILQGTLPERSCHCNASSINTEQPVPDSKMEALLRQQKCLVALTLLHHPNSWVSTSSVLPGCTLSSDGEHQKKGETAVQKLLCCKEGKANFCFHHAKTYDSASWTIACFCASSDETFTFWLVLG